LQEHGVAANEELAMQTSMVFYAILTRSFRDKLFLCLHT